MDVGYFLRRRTAFIRFFYETSNRSFSEFKKRIEDEEPPFDDPPYDESGEPAYLEEWMDAEDASNLTGQYCVAMLSDTLKLYFNELSCRVIRRDLTKDAQKRREKEGFVPVYRDSLADYFSVNWPDVPIDFDIIEQIVLARNNAMHGQELYSKTIYHNSKTVKKFPSPLFATEWELEEFKPQDGELSVFSTPRVIVEKQKLDAAIAEVEKLSDWIDSQIYCAPASNT